MGTVRPPSPCRASMLKQNYNCSPAISWQDECKHNQPRTVLLFLLYYYFSFSFEFTTCLRAVFSSALSRVCKAEGSAGTKFDNVLIWINAQRAVDGAVCSPGRTGSSSLHPHQPGIYPKQRIIHSLRICLFSALQNRPGFPAGFHMSCFQGVESRPLLQIGV